MPEEKEMFEALGETIRLEREKRGLLQRELSDKAELHYTYVSAVEKGRRNITLGSLIRIAKALETKPSELLTSAKF